MHLTIRETAKQGKHDVNIGIDPSVKFLYTKMQ